MKQTLRINGKNYFVVTPVKALFKSTMVHEVINRGDKFVVDMDTSELTILSMAEKKNKRRLNDGIYLQERNSYKKLSNNFEDIVIQLEEAGAFFQAKNLVIFHGDNDHRLITNSVNFFFKLKDYCALYFGTEQ